MAFVIRYTPLALDHLRKLSAREQTLVLDAVDVQLSNQADISTRNRKPLRPNELAIWELRLDDLRVFYVIERREPKAEPRTGTVVDGTVVVVAVGVKRGNRLLIGGQEYKL